MNNEEIRGVYCMDETLINAIADAIVAKIMEANLLWYNQKESVVEYEKTLKPCNEIVTTSGKRKKSRLLTEAMAKEIIKPGIAEVNIEANLIVTPSAKDVFNRAHVKVIKQCKEAFYADL